MNNIESTTQKLLCSSDEMILWYHYRKLSPIDLAITTLWLAFGLSMLFFFFSGASAWSARIVLLPFTLVFFGLPLAATLSDAAIYVITNCRVMIISRYALGRKVTKEFDLERVKSIAFLDQSRTPSLVFELRDERDDMHKEFDEKLARNLQSLKPLLRLLGHGLPVGIPVYKNSTILFEGLRDFDMYSYLGLCELVRKTANFKGQIVP